MPKTLLLADDSVTIQKVVGITFANEDVELVTVDNGDDALVRARQVKPDLVLADIGMPGLNGYQLCGAIRKDPNLAHVPVLLLTGTFETYDEEQAKSVGANGYIAKPFEAQALVDRVFALLAESAKRPPAAARPAAAPAPARPAATAAAQPAPPATARPAAAAPAAALSPSAAAPRAPAAPLHMPPTTPLPTVRPVAPSAPPAPRGRPELPPVPAPPQARPLAARPAAPPREVAPFEFELPGVPAPAAEAPAPEPEADHFEVEPIAADPFDASAHVAPQTASLSQSPAPLREAEPVWEAEPELEPADITPIRRAEVDPTEPRGPVMPPPDATRLFAPDLLGRSARLPDLTEPPPPGSLKSSFAFEDLDFEEPTAPPESQSQIFGDASDAAHAATVLAGAATVLAGAAAHGDEPEPDDAISGRTRVLSDPLYSQTKFLDPLAQRAGGISFSTPNPALAPPLPDLLAGEDTTEPRESSGEISGGESEPLLEAEPLDEPEFSKPFSPETAAALAEPRFQPHAGRPAASEPHAATRLMRTPELEAEPIDAEPEMIEPEPLARPAPRAMAAPRVGAPSVDPAVLAQAVEKVAWEAFGALSEQVVNEVLKKVEAVVWEVVPQLCERLLREEIARLDRDQQE